MALSLAPSAAYAFNCTFTATVNENSGANILWFGGSVSGNAADACLDFGFLHMTSGTSGKGTWVSTGAGTDGGTQLPDNQITYTPNTGAVGTDSFSMTADGDNTNDSTLNVTITIAAIKPAPQPSSATVAANSSNNTIPLTITGGTATSLAISTPASHGTATVSGTSITYTPTGGYSGPDSFAYTATDTAGTSTPATVTITVTPPPTPTVSTVSPSQGTTAGGTSVAITGTNFTGATAVSFGGTAATGVTVTDASHITATSPAGSAGTVNVTVTSVSGTSATVTADHYTYVAPVVAGAVSATVAYGSSANPITLNVSGGAAVSVAVATGASHGTATASGTSITYTPTTGYFGSDSFTYTATNAAGTSAPATVSVTVSAPTITVTATALIPGTAGTAYNHSLTASGGQAPYTFNTTLASGALPGGLTLASSGAISGTPTAAGTFTFTVSGTNSSTATPASFTSGTISLTIAAPMIAVGPITLPAPAPAINTAYSRTVSASGGAAPYAFTITSGNLPAGLTLSASGALAGTPTAAGSFTFTVQATDSNGFTGNRAYPLTVAAPTLAIAPASGTALTGSGGVAYSQAFTASGGTGPYTYALNVTSGSLPTGLSFAAGTLSGVPATAGTVTFAVTATDTGTTGTGAPFTVVGTYTLTVSAPTIALAPTTLPAPVNNTAYSQAVTATGGTAPYSYAISAGTLPANITLNSSTGVISGTTSAVGSYTFTVQATDSHSFTGSRAYAFTVAAPTLAIAPASGTALTGSGGVAYSQAFTASGGTGPYTYALNLTSGTLPTGLSFAGGTLSGVPATAGTVTFTVTATDTGTTGTGSPFTVVGTYTLTVSAPTIALAPTTLPAPASNTAYSQTVSASGGVAPYSYAISAGTLPANITLNSSTGVISGTTSAVGSFTFTVQATDSHSFTGSRAYAFTIGAPTLAIAPASGTPLTGSGGVAYSQAFTASGGTGPYTYVQNVTNGTLPTGLSFAAGTLAGTPTTTGTVTFTVTATDTGTTGAGAPFTVVGTYTLTVSAPTIALAPTTLPNGTVQAAYSQTLTATGGTTPYAFNITSGSLPAGLTLSASGALAGTPTAGGSFPVTIRVTDHNNFTVSQVYTLTINAATIALTPATLPAPQVNVAYSQALVASGGVAPYHFTVASGQLPPGLTLNNTTGVLSGTPTTAGSYNATIQATDSSTGSGPYHTSITFQLPTQRQVPVAAAVTATTPANVQVAINVGASVAGPITSVAVATNPAHGTAVPSGVNIVYTPTNNFFGTDSFTYTATGPGGTSAPATVTVTVTPLAVPVIQPVALTVLTNTPVTFDATANVANGPFAAVPVAIVTPPASGTAAVNGTKITYTPAAGQTVKNAVTFTYTVSNAFGPSAPATVAITVNPIPLPAPPQTIAAPPSSPTQSGTATADITSTAQGGPFVSASLVSVEPPNAGTVTLIPIDSAAPAVHAAAQPAAAKAPAPSAVMVNGHAFELVFVPNPAFVGTATITYTLSNAFSESVPGIVMFVVAPRPNVAADANVQGLISAQIESARRFATAQINNFNQRLEALHDGLAHSVNGLSVSFGNQQEENPSDQDDDPMTRMSGDVRRKPKGDPQLAAADPAPESSGRSNGIQSLLPDGLAIWTGGAVDFGARNSTTQRSGYNFTTNGISLGVDYRLTERLTLGIGGGYGHDSSDIGSDGTKSTGDSYSAAIYGSYHPSRDTFIDAVLGKGWLSYDSTRLIATTTQFALGHRNGDQSFGSLTAGYLYHNDQFRLSPYGRFDYSDSTLDRFTETAPGHAALTYFDQSVTTLTGTFGFKGDMTVPLGWGLLQPFVRAEYLHDFQGQNSAGLAYADLAAAGPAYFVPGTPVDRNHFDLGLGAQLAVGTFTFGLSIENSFGIHDVQDTQVRLVVISHF